MTTSKTTGSGVEAISNDHDLGVAADTVHGRLDDRGIDEWELKAARRALANLKGLLHGPPMLDLLRDQIEESEKRARQYLAESNGEYTEGQVILTAKRIRTSEFFPVLRSALAIDMEQAEQVREMATTMVYPMHPEHYALPPFLGVVETIGGLPVRVRVGVIDDPPQFITDLVDESYPARLIGKAELEDGTPFCLVLQQFKDTDDGMEINLRIWFPAACPPIYVEEHAQHYAVEFRNALRLASAALNR